MTYVCTFRTEHVVAGELGTVHVLFVDFCFYFLNPSLFYTAFIPSGLLPVYA